uniref:Acetylcholinesterase n=1 Tax=Parastrongyloides trichosuri TaxID=131310 RepID=A0A0N4ZK01_PARTI
MLKKFPQVTEYLGVPYAKPPIGNLRFMPPEPLTKEYFKKPFVANKLANTCYYVKRETGIKGFDDWNPKKLNMSEDCLQLNMWVPKRKNGAVLVFLFGGKYSHGSPSLDFYDGSALAMKTGMVVVTLNYRIGVLGFAYMNSGKLVPGNMGLLDQQLGLKWVHDNIKYFGLKKPKITLFGQGTGASSATAHMFSPVSKKYFHRIIAESGTVFHRWATEKASLIRENFDTLLSKFKCQQEKAKDKLKCIQAVNVKELVREAEKIRNPKQAVTVGAFLPVRIDSVFFNDNITHLITHHEYKKHIDIMLGKTTHEASSVMVEGLNNDVYGCKFDPKKELESKYNQCNINGTQYERILKLVCHDHNLKNEAVEFIKKVYKGISKKIKRDAALRVISDYGFDCDMNKFGRYLERLIGNKYFYVFSARSSITPWPKWMGSVHRYPLLYHFGYPFTHPEMYEKRQLKKEQTLSENVMKVLSKFAVEGRLPKQWKQFSDEKMNSLVIKKDFSLKKMGKIINVDTEECMKYEEALRKFGKLEDNF